MIGFENKGTGNYSGGKLGVEFSDLSPFFVFFFLFSFVSVSSFFMWDAWTLFSCFQIIKNKKVLAWLCPKMENNLCSLGYKNTVLKAWPLAAQFGRSDNNKVLIFDLDFSLLFPIKKKKKSLCPVIIRFRCTHQTPDVHGSRFRKWSFLAVVCVLFNTPPVNLSLCELISVTVAVFGFCRFSSSLCSLSLFCIWCNSFLQLQYFQLLSVHLHMRHILEIQSQFLFCFVFLLFFCT